ncbi:MAG: SufS family cysteine desulfurase [bacterium]|nr:SufS family cysteine desulfurase [bacterium]
MNIKSHFPIYKGNPKLIYLDSTATTLKPKVVIEKIVEYYSKYSANVKRGIYGLSEKATFEYENARKIVADFINAKPDEIIFTRGTTESLNLLAYSLGRQIIGKNDEVLTTIMEHHSNFVPWQQLCLENEAVFKILDIDENGNLIADFNTLSKFVNKKTRIATLTYVSNMLGTINPVKRIIKDLKKINKEIIVILDCAQAVPHMKVDVTDLGCDFIAFSGHKMLGPTGIGVLWGRKELLEDMYPFQFGGEMISEVKIDKATFADVPEKFEAGTPPIAQAIGLGEAIKFIEKIGINKIDEQEKKLTEYSVKYLTEVFRNDINIYGPKNTKNRRGIISFNIKNIHPHDLASILNEDNIAVRAGHHCAMPLHTRLGISSSCRVSLYIYNTKQDIDSLIKSLQKAKKLFS